VKVPSAAAGQKIDFRLNEECLLKVVVGDGPSAKEIQLATKDTPESLKKALQEALAAKTQAAAQEPQARPEEGDDKGGLLSGIKRLFGGK
jgi:molecular chaperone DnaK